MHHAKHSEHGVCAVGCQLRANFVDQFAVLFDETTMNEKLPRSEQVTPTRHSIVMRFASLKPFWNSFTRDDVLFFPFGQKPVQLNLSRRKNI